MGCCLSATSPSDSPYPTALPSSSSRAINSSQPQSATALPRPSTTHTASSLNASTTRQPRPLAEHFNRPLQRHIWVSSDKTWTRRQLDRERDAFFDTRVAGRTEVWQTLHAALEVMWAAALGDADGYETAVATAQTILEAAGLTLPTGDLSNGAYDTLGAFYSLPEWVVADPQNLAEDEAGEEDKGEEGEEEVLRRREEKGKKVVAEGDLIRVKARLSDRGGPDIVVSVGKGDSVRFLTKRVFEESDLPSTKRIRIVYMGKVLKENESLISQGWKDDHIVNALVFG